MNRTNCPGLNEKKILKLENISELFAHALVMEQEAVERYAQLADLMEAHNNSRIRDLFIRMSEIEQLHVDEINRQIKARGISLYPVERYNWISPEAPESVDPADLHYLMTPYQALSLAYLNEQRAFEYYSVVASTTRDEETRSLAKELAEEEEDHVAKIKIWLERTPGPDDDWSFDDDPPWTQD